MAVHVRFVAVAMLTVGLVCGVISTALDYWYYYHKADGDSSFKAYSGLWESCTKNEMDKHCSTWKYVHDKSDINIKAIYACRAMMIIGVICNGVTFVFGLYVTLKQSSVVGTMVTAVLGGILYIVAVLIYAAKYKDLIPAAKSLGHLHAGFALAIVAAVLNWAAVGVFGFDHRASGYQSM